MIPTILSGVIAGLPVAGLPPTTHILHLGDSDAGDYGVNQSITTVFWSDEFGSITATTVPSGTLGSFELTAIATESGNNFYVVLRGVQARDFFIKIAVQGLFDGAVETSVSDGYFVSELDDIPYTFWHWDDVGVGDFPSLGDRAVGFVYNPNYQTGATTASYDFGPGSSYAWTGWPDTGAGSYQGQFAQGGKINVSAAFGAPVIPSGGAFDDPAIFGKHNGISIGVIESSGGDHWILLLLQNSDGTENYQLSGSPFTTPLNTADAVYHDLDPDMVSWGTKAFGWNLTVLGWGGVGYSEFTLENLDA